MSRLLRIAGGVLVVCVAAFTACRLLLPERYAVNAPMTNSLFGWGIDPPSATVVKRRLHVVPGLAIHVYARVPRVRFLLPTPSGDLIASVPRDGRVVILERDANGDGLPDGRRDLLTGLDRPHGLDLHDGWLYVAEGGAVGRVRFDDATGTVRGALEHVVTGLPEGGNHWTRTVRFGPDGRMYVTVGSDCNVCFEKDERRAAMLRFDADGSHPEIYARGLRNSVGFDWQPGTGALYATDNGRDLLGDDFPPCELNRIVQGGDYGWPVANGNRVLDPDVGAGHEARARASIPPAFDFPAHNAPLGMTFLRHPLLPGYQGAALVALHGSWNRTHKDGYQVVSLHWAPDGTISSHPFAWGFLEHEDVIGRPVDVVEAGDGTVFVSDDYAGAVYRIARDDGGAQATVPAARAVAHPLAGVPEAERASRAARGATLFEAHGCAGCHDAARARPGVVAVPLDKLGERYDVDSLAKFFTAPTPPMPIFALDGGQRRDLAVYLLTRGS